MVIVTSCITMQISRTLSIHCHLCKYYASKINGQLVCTKSFGLILRSFMLRAFLSFQPVLNTVNSPSQNGGK